MATILGALIARRKSLNLITKTDVQNCDSPETRLLLDSVRGGRWLLLGILAASVPMYLDRAFVAGVIGIEAAGQYGFLMLFVIGATTVAGIVVQKVGPALVHAHQAGASVGEQWCITRTWIFGMVSVVCLGIAIAWLLILHGPLWFLGHRYELQGIHFLAIAALGSLQGVVLLDWMLLSRDQEFRVFLAAAIYAAVAAAFAVWLALTPPTLLKVLTCLIAAKLVHLAALSWLVIALPNIQLRQIVGSNEPQ